MSAAAAAEPTNDIADWVDELNRIATSAESLSLGVRLALVATIDAFAAEDGFLKQQAADARTLLASHTSTPAPVPAATLLTVLRQRLRRDLLGHQAQTAG